MLSFTLKIVLYVIILTLLAVLLTKEGFKQFQRQDSARVKTINPVTMYKSRTQEFEANAALRGNVIDYFDGYLMNEIKFDSPRVSMDAWAQNQKKQDIKRAIGVSKLIGDLGYN
jgi:hypothetical protein